MKAGAVLVGVVGAAKTLTSKASGTVFVESWSSKLTWYTPAEERGGLKVKVFKLAEKVTHVGFPRIVIEHVSNSGSVIVGRA